MDGHILLPVLYLGGVGGQKAEIFTREYRDDQAFDSHLPHVDVSKVIRTHHYFNISLAKLILFVGSLLLLPLVLQVDFVQIHSFVLLGVVLTVRIYLYHGAGWVGLPLRGRLRHAFQDIGDMVLQVQGSAGRRTVLHVIEDHRQVNLLPLGLELFDAHIEHHTLEHSYIPEPVVLEVIDRHSDGVALGVRILEHQKSAIDLFHLAVEAHMLFRLVYLRNLFDLDHFEVELLDVQR